MFPPRITALRGYGIRDLADRSFEDRPAPGPVLTMSEMTTLLADGGALISVTVAEVVLRKMVYVDGRFHVQLEEARDRIAFAGSKGRASMTYGAATVPLVPNADAISAERARQLVASANVVLTFRRLAERLGRTRRTSACAVSVRLTWALIAEVAGEAGAVDRLASIYSTHVPRHQAPYDADDDFDRRWIERAAQVLDPEARRIEGAMSSGVPSLDSAFHTLLKLEAAWYAVASGASEIRSRAAR
jgi:hypothetical protein